MISFNSIETIIYILDSFIKNNDLDNNDPNYVDDEQTLYDLTTALCALNKMRKDNKETKEKLNNTKLKIAQGKALTRIRAILSFMENDIYV